MRDHALVDVSILRATILPVQRLLAAARAASGPGVHRAMLDSKLHAT